jgi:hypothetical protein
LAAVEKPSPEKRLKIMEQIEELYAIDAKTLLQMNLQPIQYVIENLLPKGLTILAGSPKVGKSWIVLDMCDKIAKGEFFWGYNTMQGTTLYLCLEDTYNRIQTRLECITENVSEQTFFATIINDINSGFEEQIAGFIKQHPDTVLVVVDTFQKIRSKTIDRNIYASEYDEANKIKAIADRFNIAIMLVHHTRKLVDSDPFNMISGSTGIIGACDGIMVLNKEKRLSNKATLNVTGRDIEDKDLILEFDKDKFVWEFVTDSINKSVLIENPTLTKIIEIIREKKKRQGIVSEFINEADLKIQPNAFSRLLNTNINVLKDSNIKYELNRTATARYITFEYKNDDNDGYDDKI